jgi:pyridoxamine 5'-phosphate oxidase
MAKTELAGLRRDYSKSELSRASVADDPFVQFDRGMDEALHSEVIDATAMTLATAGADGRPSSRVVLLKGFDGDGFVFFTNYNSRKGHELAENPFAAINFFWADLERQVNISGHISRVSAEESDEYFRSRPFTSRVGAWASNQSEKIESRIGVVARAAKLMVRYATGNVPRPPHWGGYRLRPDRFEFWQGRESRLHDRICYELIDGKWEICRLSP